MGLRSWIKRLERAGTDGVVLTLRDGSVRVFSDLEVFKEMFLCRTDLFLGKARPSEVLDAVRAATKESRAAFEDEYGSIEMVGHIIAPDYQGGWVDEHRLLEDGTVEITHHEGGSETAERIKREAKQSSGAF
jgi:acylphosphatase